MNGPYMASKHDVTTFREDGLKARTPAGKRGIADNGYLGEKNILSVPKERRIFSQFRIQVILKSSGNSR
jgi:hypothetical protein